MQPVAAEVVRLLSRVLSISRDKGSPVFPKPGHGGFDVFSAETVSRFIAYASDDGRVLEKHGYACPAFCRSLKTKTNNCLVASADQPRSLTVAAHQGKCPQEV
jgi:hypothetical protein